MPGDKLFQLISMVDWHPGDLGTHHPRVDIKGGQQPEPVAGKLKILDDCPAQIAGAQHHHGMPAVDAQNFTNLLFQTVHLIPISLLAELSKTEQVLTNLGCRQPHGLSQGAR